jgi:hypothetical protein
VKEIALRHGGGVQAEAGHPRGLSLVITIPEHPTRD